MKRLILAGLCCVMLAGCTNANPDSISEGEVHLGEVLDQTGHSFSYVASGSELTAGLYTDGEGWFLTSVRTVKGQQDPVITDQPMRQAETGSDGIQLWYGVYGSPEEPWLALPFPGCFGRGALPGTDQLPRRAGGVDDRTSGGAAGQRKPPDCNPG